MVAYSAAARLLLAREAWRFGDDLPRGPLMKIYGFFVGLLSTLMGVGGGLYSNLLMTFYGPTDPSGGCDLLGAGGADSRSRRARLCLLPGWPAAAHFRIVAALQLPYTIGYVFADRRLAGDADQPVDRAARRAYRACNVEAHARSRLRLLHADSWAAGL